MQSDRPIVMSVAGLDPCGGAGLFADIKTFEQHKVYGLGITTAQTLQTQNDFFSIRWEGDKSILEAISKLLANYSVQAVKIGIVQNIQSLHRIVSSIYAFNKNIPIIVDPVIRSTTEFNFWQEGFDSALLYQVLQMTELITPNYKEVMQLVPAADEKEAAGKLSHYCNVLLKGGHNKKEPGVDYLYTQTGILKLEPHTATIFPKHGSGCVLSSSIAANMALGNDLATACRKAKSYTEKFLLSNQSLLGFHVS
jgi:hydroxymethylpyrimidine/phosphomethylpyrimidine kinase